MSNTSWSDLNRDGKRLESIIKMLNTKFHTTVEDNLRLAYVDRIIKATNAKHELVKTVFGIRELIKQHNKETSTIWNPPLQTN